MALPYQRRLQLPASELVHNQHASRHGAAPLPARAASAASSPWRVNAPPGRASRFLSLARISSAFLVMRPTLSP